MTSKSMTTVMKPSPLSKSEDWHPQKHHRKGLKFLLEQACAGLILDPGLGKTSIVLAALKVLKKDKMPCRALIIAPRRPCYLVWPREQQKWKDFHELKLVMLHGPQKEANLKKDADLYIMNPEGLPWLMSNKRFQKLNPDILVIDESSKFKHTDTQRFKMLKPVLPTFRRRWILTGTPAPKGYLNLFGQVYILDLGGALGQYISHYRSEYFSQTGYGGFNWKLNPGAEQKIQKKIKPLLVRMDAEDYIDLPKEIIDDIVVELDTAARKSYEEMEKDLFTNLSSGQITAASAGVASMKCRQMANGGVWDAEHMFHHIHDAKLEALKELVAELNGQPILIAYQFKHELKRLLDAFGKTTPYLGGGVSDKRADEIERNWNAGNIPILFGHPSSIGHGLNLQKSGNHICWFALTWDFEEYDQFNRRLRRSGASYNRVFIHRIVTADTIDEAIMLSLAQKYETQKGLLDALKDYASNKSLKTKVNLMLYNTHSMEYGHDTTSTKETKMKGDPEETKNEETTEKDETQATPKEPKFAKAKPGSLVLDVTPGKKPKFSIVPHPQPVKGKKMAKAAKKVSKKEEGGKREEADARTVKLLAKENPKREGTESHKRFKLYSKYDTVGALKKAGLTAADLAHDSKNGHIKISA